MRISDWSSDVCSSDLRNRACKLDSSAGVSSNGNRHCPAVTIGDRQRIATDNLDVSGTIPRPHARREASVRLNVHRSREIKNLGCAIAKENAGSAIDATLNSQGIGQRHKPEAHTSELQDTSRSEESRVGKKGVS